MKLKEDMYVRFKPELKEKICKIKEFKNDGFLVLIDNTEYWFEEIDVINASFNIIDLIEVGDIIEYEVPCSLETNGILHVLSDIVDNDMLKELKENGDIKLIGILTKEKFKADVYEVGD